MSALADQMRKNMKKGLMARQHSKEMSGMQASLGLFGSGSSGKRMTKDMANPSAIAKAMSMKMKRK